jgi:hypothetical protein
MNATRRYAILFLMLLLTPVVQAQPNIPHIAYVYPAGGRQGTTFQVTVGGQFLGAVSNAYISGTGIQATVIEYNRPMNQKEFNDLRDRLKKLQDKWQATRKSSSPTNVWTAADAQMLAEIRGKILKNPPNRQANPAMAETVILKITIASDAEPGEREIRLRTPNALSNPLVFCVGQLPEFSKLAAKAANPDLNRFLERLGQKPVTGTPKSEMLVGLPATINGQIMPGGVDRYRFWVRKGRQIVISVSARDLIPYLADAVPGWFEATLTLYDAKGNELAYDNRFRFRPDPVIHFEAPHDGEYVVEIKDSLYRGREDFVYRATLGELPFVTDIFPLGGPADAKTRVELKGWNLPTTTLTLDNKNKEPGIHPISVSRDGKYSKPVPFAVDTLPECIEQEPNDTPATAQPITPPVIVNGRIDPPGDEDVFRFEGHAGERIIAEVLARRLDSPLDSVLKLTDAAGRQLAFNDDYEDKGSGLETHHADSYLTATLPANGIYFVHVCDTQHQGGANYAYRLRISEPRPDFALRAVPSSLNARVGMNVPVTVYALRKDGFTNAINLSLKDAPPGFALNGARVPENQDKVQFTLKVPAQPAKVPVTLSLEGSAIIQGQTVVHAAVPAEDMMQAFAYRHLVPVKEMAVIIAGNPRPLFAKDMIKIISVTPVKIPAGGTAQVRIATPSSAFAERFDLDLSGAPEGVAIQSVSPITNGVEIVLSCDEAKSKPGLNGNLIVNVLLKKQASATNAPKQGNQRRNPIGTLPAIPFEVVAK